MKVRFTIPGEPKAKQRPRMAQGGFVYTPKETVQYENLVKLEYQAQSEGARFPDDEMLDVRILAYYSIPKSASKKKRQAMLDKTIRPVKKVDVDNLVKAVLDSLNNVAYKDDVQVVDCQVRKFYAEVPRVEVTIQEAWRKEER